VLLSDGGGKAKAPLRPIVGAAKVARFLAAIGPQGAQVPGLQAAIVEVNGAPAVAAWTDEGPYMALQVVVAAGRIQQVLLVSNPDKLAGIAAAGAPGRPAT
jgi:RNA polymerase sigma-70 factor (ECF subfamily)